MTPTVTFDVFSALTDSRTGGAAFFEELARTRSWNRAPEEIFDCWDSENKGLHRRNAQWAPFGQLAEQALGLAYGRLGLRGDVADDCRRLLAGMGEWPLWPDVSATVLASLKTDRLGLLTNIDDALLERSRALALGLFDPRFVWTSERARAYKPSMAFYQGALREMGPYVHVASSARDVRGALDAGITCIRLIRRRHDVDPRGPQPLYETDAFAGLPDLLSRVLAEL